MRRTRDNELFSTKITAGNRTYYFNVKISVDKTKYLVIKELWKNKKEGQIMVFQEYSQAFCNELEKVLKRLDKAPHIDKAYDLNRIRRVYPNAYVGWELEDDDRLAESYSQKVTVGELSKIFQRKPSAIRSRLKKLNLIKVV